MRNVVNFFKKNPEQIFFAALGIASVGAVVAAAQPDGVPAYVRAVNGIPAAEKIVTPSQAYLAEKVLGVGDGMAASGWKNPEMMKRLDTLEARQDGHAREALKDIYASGYKEGISGQWTEDALEGYLSAAETPFRDIRSGLRRTRLQAGDIGDDIETGTVSVAAQAIAAGHSSAAAAPYMTQAIEGMIETELTVGEVIAMREGAGTLLEGMLAIDEAAGRTGFLAQAPETNIEASNDILRDPFQVEQVELNQGHEIGLSAEKPDTAIALDREEVKVTLKQERIPVKFEQERIPIKLDRSLIDLENDPFEASPKEEAGYDAGPSL